MDIKQRYINIAWGIDIYIALLFCFTGVYFHVFFMEAISVSEYSIIDATGTLCGIVMFTVMSNDTILDKVAKHVKCITVAKNLSFVGINIMCLYMRYEAFIASTIVFGTLSIIESISMNALINRVFVDLPEKKWKTYCQNKSHQAVYIGSFVGGILAFWLDDLTIKDIVVIDCIGCVIINITEFWKINYLNNMPAATGVAQIA